jgi:outer membrane protein insertion porin family
VSRACSAPTPGTVFASLPFRVGDSYTDDKGAAALRALFATGLFKDVRIEVDGKVVVVVVEERAVIANVDFVGTEGVRQGTLVKALKDIGIGEGQPFDRAWPTAPSRNSSASTSPAACTAPRW